MQRELRGSGVSSVMRVDVGFWSSESGAREIPEDQLAVFSNTDESHRSIFGSFGVESDSCHPTRVSWAVSDDMLLERCVHGKQVVLSSSLWKASQRSESRTSERERDWNSRQQSDHLDSMRHMSKNQSTRQRHRGACTSKPICQRKRKLHTRMVSSLLLDQINYP